MKSGQLTRHNPIRRRARRDPVSPELRIAVLERDGGCVRVLFQEARPHVCDPCVGRLTLDHVQDGYGRMGKRAPSDPAHLVTLCEHHHLDGWATANRSLLRQYLALVSLIEVAP